ncbi:transcription initiation factor IIB-like [Mangifera indica]|uniref:transcription initiation factor IIB-like n=1 Tax=Mangifera indica TaxID=29780 RepID=UPI001CFA3223|nr:transcription initiation factor IIB-like [Mangifera indica]
MDFDYCFECKKNTDIVVDHKQGDRVCTECGLVLEAHSIDETAEWRNFNDDNNDKDPNRVGSAMSPFLDHGNQLVTLISNPHKTGDHSGDVLSSRRLHKAGTNLVKGLEIIASMADSLGLVATIKNRADEIYVKVEEHKLCRGKKLNAILAACLFIACRENKLSRTLKELGTVADGVKVKEINKAIDLIRKHLEVSMGGLATVELVRRFCSNLGVKNRIVVAVQEAVTNVEELDIRRSPKSVLAAIIYMITQLSEDRKCLKDISMIAEVAELTIKKSYKDLYPYATRFMPNWYANEEDIKKLSPP